MWTWSEEAQSIPKLEPILFVIKSGKARWAQITQEGQQIGQRRESLKGAHATSRCCRGISPRLREQTWKPSFAPATLGPISLLAMLKVIRPR